MNLQKSSHRNSSVWLPILYFDSGGIPEYCDGFGVKFDNNFKEKLYEIIDGYEIYEKN